MGIEVFMEIKLICQFMFVSKLLIIGTKINTNLSLSFDILKYTI
jgi:hypothetical protein